VYSQLTADHVIVTLPCSQGKWTHPGTLQHFGESPAQWADKPNAEASFVGLKLALPNAAHGGECSVAFASSFRSPAAVVALSDACLLAVMLCRRREEGRVQGHSRAVAGMRHGQAVHCARGLVSAQSPAGSGACCRAALRALCSFSELASCCFWAGGAVVSDQQGRLRLVLARLVSFRFDEACSRHAHRSCSPTRTTGPGSRCAASATAGSTSTPRGCLTCRRPRMPTGAGDDLELATFLRNSHCATCLPSSLQSSKLVGRSLSVSKNFDVVHQQQIPTPMPTPQSSSAPDSKHTATYRMQTNTESKPKHK
jgi:hypothetical protein